MRQSYWLLITPQMATAAQDEAEAKAKSRGFDPFLPSRWQVPNYLGHQDCFPGSGLAETWSQEVKQGMEFRSLTDV